MEFNAVKMCPTSFRRISFHLAHFPFFFAQIAEEMNKISYLFLFILLCFLFSGCGEVCRRWCHLYGCLQEEARPRTVDLTYASLHSFSRLSLSCLFRSLGSLPIVFPVQLQAQGWEVHGGLKSCLLSSNPKMKPEETLLFWLSSSASLLSCLLSVSQTHTHPPTPPALGLWNGTVFTQEIMVSSASGRDLVLISLLRNNSSGIPLLTQERMQVRRHPGYLKSLPALNCDCSLKIDTRKRKMLR